MSYARARLAAEEEAYSHRLYIAEGLRVISENTARRVGGNYLSRAWQQPRSAPRPEKPADVVAVEIINGAGLTFKGGVRE